MDERLRQLERTFLSENTPDSLYLVMREYARLMSIPDADIAALSIVNKGETYKPRGRKSGWGRPLMSREQLESLYDVGYDAGVYFLIKDPPENAVEIITQRLFDANEDNVRQVGYMDTVDNIDVGPGNSYARSLAPDGRERWEVNREIIQEALRYTDEDRQEIAELLKDYYRDIYRGKKKTHYGRFFIPAWVLDQSWAVSVMHFSQGMSRATVRDRSSSTVRWTDGETYASRLRRDFFEHVGGFFDNTPREFGFNLLLASEHSGVRRVPLRNVQTI